MSPNNKSPRIRVIQKIYGSMLNPGVAINYSKSQYKKFIKDVVEGTIERTEYIEETVKKIMVELKNDNLDHTISYQSRVGPLKWIGPSTDEEIIKYSKEKKGIVIVPVAFVSEHSETL